MKIDNKLFYKLYNSSNEIKKEELKKDIEKFENTLKTFKGFLNNASVYFEKVSKEKKEVLYEAPFKTLKEYTDIIPSFVVVEGKKYTKKSFDLYYNGYQRAYKTLQLKKEEYNNIKDSEINKNIYNFIIREFNLSISELIVKEQYVLKMGYRLGNLECVRKTPKRKPINWDASNKNKQRLLDEGKIPYYKEDEKKAKEKGLKYKGIKWLIRYNEDNVYVNHYNKYKYFKFELIKSNITLSLKKILSEYKKSKFFNINDYRKV